MNTNIPSVRRPTCGRAGATPVAAKAPRLPRGQAGGVGVADPVGAEPRVGQHGPGLVQAGDEPGGGAVAQRQPLHRAPAAPPQQAGRRAEGVVAAAFQQVLLEQQAHLGGDLLAWVVCVRSPVLVITTPLS